MATAAVLRLVRSRATIVHTLHRCTASRRSLLPLSSPSSAFDQPLHSSIYAPSRLRALAFTSATPAEGTADGRDAPLEPSAVEEPLSQYPEMKKGDWICPKCNFMNFARNFRCLQCKTDGPKSIGFDNVEMRKGDWTCPGCNYMNFARNTRCLRCMANRPGYDASDNVVVKKGDWNCPECDFLNFSHNTNCRRCSADKGVSFGNAPFKRLDWNCPKCQFVNFARNSTCLRCQEPRSNVQLIHGEWECPSCKFLNFRRNQNCLKCNQCRPEDETTRQGDGLLGMPTLVTEETLKFSDYESRDEDIESLIKGFNKLVDTKS